MVKKSIGCAEEIDDGKGFSFIYGKIVVADFNDINNPVETTYFSCIRLGIVEKVKNFAGDSFVEVQFIYRDNDGKTHCEKIDKSSGRYRIEVLKQGNMMIEL